MINLSVESNIDEVEKSLEELQVYIPNITRKILKRISAKGKQKIQKAYKSSGLKQRSGTLYKSIYGVAKTEYKGVIGAFSKQAYKFIPQAYGADIKAKNNYMTFQIDGKWVKVKSIRIPARNLMEAAEQYVGSSEMSADIDIVLARELKKVLN